VVEDDEGAFLSAIHFLVQRNTTTEETDLLLAAVTHALDGVALNQAELTERVGRIWPGPPAGQHDIEKALSVGTELGLLVTHDDLEGNPEWMLTQRGAEDVAAHHAWASEIRRQNAMELASRAEDALGVELDSAEASLWLDALIRALVAGIQQAQDAYAGNIEQLVSGVVRPRSIDREIVLAALDSDDADRTEFLRATALSAMDPLQPFGNEIISYITTGCVLHAVVAQSARAKVNNSLGGGAGERAFLDTPCLVDLLHVERISKPMEVAIREAVAQGWEVQVLEHSIEELRDVFSRAVETMPTAFQKATSLGAKDEWLASLVNDQITSMFVEARQAGLYASLEDFGLAAERIETRLVDLGVVIRPASNDDRTEVNRFASALTESLSGTSRRSQTVVNRDAETMAAAARRRRRQRAQKRGSKWPGAWVITTDRHMGPAFCKVTGQRVSLTVTPSQWSRLLATCPTQNMVDLAVASANQWIEEAMWAIPVRFPPETAAALALSLSPEAGGSLTDMKVAQLTLQDALDSPGATDTALAAQVLERRTKRRDQTQTVRVRSAEGRAEADKIARLRAEKAQAESLAREQNALADASRSTNETEQLQRQLNWERRRTKRIVVSALVFAVGLATVTAAVLTSNAWLIVIAVTSLAAVLFFAYRWCRDEQARLLTALIAGIVQATTTAVTLVDYFALLPKP
jgi:hypothetical protein